MASSSRLATFDFMAVATATVGLFGVIAWKTAFIGRSSEFTAFLWIWFLHTMIAAFLAYPIVLFGRKRAHWNTMDLLAFLLPFTAWVLLWNLNIQSKSLANLGEPFYLSFAIVGAAIVRVVVGSDAEKRTCSILLVGVLILTAACIYSFTPSLPE